MTRTLTLVAVAFVVSFTADHSSADPAKAKGKPVTTQELMRRKLALSQEMLASLTLNDLKKAGTQASDLLTLRKDPAWTPLKGVTYESFSQEFTRTLEGIVKASKANNLESAKLHYLGLTLTCFNCHAYVRDSKEGL